MYHFISLAYSLLYVIFVVSNIFDTANKKCVAVTADPHGRHVQRVCRTSCFSRGLYLRVKS